MGLRGRGATPLAKRRQDSPAAEKTALAWMRGGLSRADRVAAFVESLPITSGPLAGQPFKLLPWQRDVIATLYATDDAGRRVVRQCVVSMGRKGGKTGFVSALALAHLCGPEAEPRGQVVSAAVTREQAALIHNEMAAAIAATPWLAERCNVKSFRKEIDDLQTGSAYRSLVADARSVHGLNPSVWIFDELAQAPNRELLDALQTATGARAEPLGIVISTRSPDPNSPLEELLRYGEQIATGAVADPSFASFSWHAPADCALDDEAGWLAANPGLPHGLPRIDEMRAAAAQARRIPSSAAAFRALRLNQPVAQDVRFVGPEDWAACAGEIDLDALAGAESFVGLDLSATTDLTAAVAYFPAAGAVLVRAWLPAEGIRDRALRDRAPYDLWADAGTLTLIPGRVIDKRAVARNLAQWLAGFDVRVVAFDRWGITELKAALDAEGVRLPLEPHGQGFKDMATSVDALERTVLAHELRHAGNPLLTWCMSNVAIETDPAGNRKFSKRRAIGRIDAAVALAMAVGTAARSSAPESVPGWVGTVLAM
jgi:phage terminase large subunit-like protein